MKRTRKIFALLLSICMIVTMLPTVAFAANTGEPVIPEGGDSEIMLMAMGAENTPASDANALKDILGDNAEVKPADSNTVVLNDDIALTDKRPDITGDIVLDLNGHTLSKGEAFPDEKALIKVSGTGSLTIQGETGTISGNGGLILANGTANVILNSGTISATVATDGKNYPAVSADNTSTFTMNDGTVTAEDSGISAFGNAQVEIKGGSVTSSGSYAIGTNGSAENSGSKIKISGDAKVTGADTLAGVYLPNGTLTVEGGTITGGAGIVVRGGELTATGGTIEAKAGTDENIKIGDVAYSVPAAAIAVDENENYTGKTDKVTISGETAVKAPEGGKTVSYTEKGGTNTPDPETFDITGGTFQTQDANGNPKGDTSVFQYIDQSLNGLTSDGTVKAKDNVDDLYILDFGYLADAKTGVQGGKYTSGNGIVYNASDWANQTFYLCFNRVLKEGETITVTATCGGHDFSINCVGNGVSPRFAWSFLNSEQNSENVPLIIDDWTLTAKDASGDSVTVLEEVATTQVTGDDTIEPVENVSIQDVGFKAKAADAKAAIDAGLDDKTVDDASDNTMYIVLGKRVTLTSGQKLKVEVKKDATDVYSEELATADNNAKVFYFRFTETGAEDMGGSGDSVAKIGTADAPGKYTIDLYFGNKSATYTMYGSRTLDLYKVVYDAGEGEFSTGEETFDAGLAMLDDAGNLDKPADPTRSDYAFTTWSTAEVNENNHTITYTAQWRSIGGVNNNHKVTVDSNIINGTVVANPDADVKAGTKVTLTVTPAEGYILDADTLIAKTDSNNIELTKVDDTTYTFEMPAADVTVTATFKADVTEPEKDTVCDKYTDIVTSGDDGWYHKYVHYMIENGLMTGTTADKFEPKMNLNRAMVAQILYAKAEKPAVKTDKSFPDVLADQWYTDAVRWAAENGAVSGYTDGTFKPMQPVTREELAVMLYGKEGTPSVTGNELAAFVDASSISDWAQNAMLWAVKNDIMNGDNNTKLNPKATSTRAEAATMLYQYFN